ncbi:hypothetical protein H0H93_009329 [Arthromyces matolae]|nr:hypothetical protein H0H93_009329 [Arthromyces matolae]
MRTGEEQRIVDDNAPLLACTVEMLTLSKYYDVAVIDEIQMISDPDRGSAWTHAVLGVNAGEVHLCGEETAVPIIEKLLEYTGDELVVKRYQRLSPLEVQEQSLEGDLTKVRKGDCIVTFSRSNIFKYKREIEARTDLRCAIVYGRLPPEIRSEQAALFNDPDSGYDVLIGSDAIGMGLNLKIRRVIFETTKKYDGRIEMPLSISQTKQIAGRAGRYGLHGDDSPAGFVTSLHQGDIDHIKRALDASPVQLSNARLGISSDRFFGLASALPANASTLTLLQAHYYITRTPEILRQTELKPREHHDLCEFIDQRMPSMSRLDRSLLLLAPIAGRDPVSLELVQKFLAAYQDEMYVDLWKILEGSPLIENLETVEMLMEGNGKSKQMTPMVLSLLESLHKAIVLYVWMTFRRPLSWSCIEEVDALKIRIERALDWGLQALTRLQQGTKPSERPIEKERVPFKRHYGDNTWRKSAIPSSPSPKNTNDIMPLAKQASNSAEAALVDAMQRIRFPSGPSLIVCIPPEVLEEIFQICAAIPLNRGERPNRLAISQVCQQWREITLNNPWIWGRIEVGHAKLAKELISRSAGAYLDIVGAADTRMIKVRGTDLQPHTKRIRSFDISFRREYELGNLFSKIGDDFPNLSSVSLNHLEYLYRAPRGDANPVRSKVPYSSRIERLELRGVAVDWISKLKDMTMLELRGAGYDCTPSLSLLRQIIQSSPRLEHLSLDRVHTYDLDKVSSLPPVPLPRLGIFYIEERPSQIFKVLALMSIPPSARVILDFRGFKRSPGDLENTRLIIQNENVKFLRPTELATYTSPGSARLTIGEEFGVLTPPDYLAGLSEFFNLARFTTFETNKAVLSYLPIPFLVDFFSRFSSIQTLRVGPNDQEPSHYVPPQVLSPGERVTNSQTLPGGDDALLDPDGSKSILALAEARQQSRDGPLQLLATSIIQVIDTYSSE